MLRAVYAADGANNAQQGLEHFYRWADGIGVPELSRLARTVKTWEAEILAVHPTNGCSNARRQVADSPNRKPARPLPHPWW